MSEAMFRPRVGRGAYPETIALRDEIIAILRDSHGDLMTAREVSERLASWHDPTQHLEAMRKQGIVEVVRGGYRDLQRFWKIADACPTCGRATFDVTAKEGSP